MKRPLIILILFFSLISILVGQKPSIELTFTAIDSTNHVQLDSIRIMNLTQSGDTVLYWPDTVLILDYMVGIPENITNQNGFEVSQNYPNPFSDQTNISVTIPETDLTSITVIDAFGRTIINEKRILKNGRHTFRLTPGGEKLYFFNASWRDVTSSVKLIQSSLSLFNHPSLEYIGIRDLVKEEKSSVTIQSFSFNLGDELLFIGYTDTLQSGLPDTPEASQTYTLQFATKIPCIGTPTVDYEGQLYNTIQVFSQCWLKENLNVGKMIQGNETMTNNGIFEKYCYNNEPDSCQKYGGLYQWWEVMNYIFYPGVQGICPIGWHVPTDVEYKILEGASDSEYNIGSGVWDQLMYRGYDAGKNLKDSSYWSNTGIDKYYFSAVPGGYCTGYNNSFHQIGTHNALWTSSGLYNNSRAWTRGIGSESDQIYRFDGYDEYGYSVRCIRDY